MPYTFLCLEPSYDVFKYPDGWLTSPGMCLNVERGKKGKIYALFVQRFPFGNCINCFVLPIWSEFVFICVPIAAWYLDTERS